MKKLVAVMVAALSAGALDGIGEVGGAGAQEALPGSFGEIIEVRVVNIEVVVTDRDGVRVQGLTPPDFRLKVDGKVVPIEYFTEVLGGDAVTPTAGGPQPVPSLAPGSAVGTSYLVFVDDFFSIPRDRDRVLRALLADLPRLGEGDRLALVAYDGRGLEMLSSWSQSLPALERAFKAALDRPAHGLQRLAERRANDSERSLRPRAGFFERPFSSVGDRLDLTQRAYAERLAEQVQGSVMAAAATLRSFAAPPGRKVMLLLAGGWPFSPVEYALNYFQADIIEPGIPHGQELYEPLVDTANRLGYTVYPVDVPGLEGEGVDASQNSVAEARFAADSSLNREQERETTLSFVAQGTGGRALLNGLRQEALERVAEDTRSYYWLGFTPARQGDDRRHAVEVEMTRPGLRVRARAGFQDVSKQREVSMAVESALLFGNPPSGQPLAVQVGRPEKRGRSTARVPLALAIPLDALTTLPDGDHRVADLELRLAALDEEGRRSEIPVVPLRVTVPADAKPGGFVRYDTKVELRRGRQQLVVAIYDRIGGALLSTTLEISP
jgi:VWFA-related protein